VVKRFEVASGTGAVTPISSLSAPAAMWGVRLSQLNGRAFATAFDINAVPRLFEFSASRDLRELSLSKIGTLAAGTGDVPTALSILAAARITDVVASGSAAVVGFAPGKFVTGLEAYAPSGETNPPAAVTYRAGCPE
jgi:hypothetical protein